jgi:histone acetyltransferase MYST1
VPRDRLLTVNQINSILSTGAANSNSKSNNQLTLSKLSNEEDKSVFIDKSMISYYVESSDHSSGHGNFSAEDIEAHEEATKVKNIDSIQYGCYKMSTWYYSPLPVEYNQFSTLFFCEFCLNFFGYEVELKRHSLSCKLRHPPGNEIYRSREHNITIAAFEVDGAVEKVYSQNLCYLSKLFLDHKTLEYDCSPFLFYILCEINEVTGFYHMVGYFSKEKISLSNFNLACILTLPCHQRKGYGKVLISLSYELSKVEEKVGSPEKPISDLGLLSYMSYWTSILCKLLDEKRFGGDHISIEDLSKLTCITAEDIIDCLKTIHILVWYKGKWVFSQSNLNNLLNDRRNKKAKAQAALLSNPSSIFVSEIRPEKLSWTPFFQSKRAKILSGFAL